MRQIAIAILTLSTILTACSDDQDIEPGTATPERREAITLTKENLSTQLLETEFYLHKIDFIDEQVGYAFTSRDEIIKTTTGGERWELLTSAGMPLADLYFINETTGYLVGEENFESFLFVTQDGGASFEQRALPQSAGYNRVYAYNEQLIFVLGEDGVIRSVDGGNTWQSLPLDFSVYRGIYMDASGRVLLSGLFGTLYESTDYGETWQKVNLGVDLHLYDIHHLEGDFIFTGQAIHHVSQDLSEVMSSNDFEIVPQDIHWYSKDTGLLYGQYDTGGLFDKSAMSITNDGGQTWTRYDEDRYFNHLDFYAPRAGYATASGDLVKLSF